MKPLISLLSLVLVAASALAEESWQLVLVNGQEAGYAYMATRPTVDEGETLFETTNDMMFRLKRMGRGIEISTRLITVEDVTGQIRRLHQSLNFSNNETIYRGVVEDGQLLVTTKTVGPAHQSVIEDWPDDVPGPEEIRRRLMATGFVPGSTVSLNQFDFTLGAPMEAELTVEDEESLKINGALRRVFRTVLRQRGLPDTISWVDERGSALKTSFSMMGMTIETVEVDPARVQDYVRSGDPAEVFMQSTIAANVRLPRPRSLDSVVYRVQAKDGELPEMAAPNQRWLGPADKSGRLLRIDTRVPGDDRKQRVGLKPSGELSEFLIANAMMQSDNADIIAFARGQILDETDAWNAAVRLERAVYEKIQKKSMDVAFASALETFQTETGDCSEHAVLLSTLCRAVGVPSRVAMGLVYVGGIFGGHAWSEVWIDGDWYALDGTIGRGSADPTHVELGATSLKDGSFSTGLVSAISSLGNLDLTILEYQQGDTTTRVNDSRQRATVQDGRFIDYLEGVSFAVPDGFKADASTPDILEMSNQFTLTEVTAVDGASHTRIDLTARQVPFEFTLDRFQRELKQRLGGSAKVTRTEMAGRPAVVISDAAGTRVAGAIVEDTLYALRARDLDDAGLVAFERILRTLRID